MEDVAKIYVNFFSELLAAHTLITGLGLLCLWFFLRSAITSGVKRGILLAHAEIQRLKKNPPPSPEEQMEEELKGWE